MKNKFLLSLVAFTPAIIYLTPLSFEQGSNSFLKIGLFVACSILLSLIASRFKYYELIVLFVYLGLFNSVYFHKVVLDMPRDTTAYYEIFHVFYSHIYYFHELPLWIPDAVYGVNSSFLQLGFIPPISFLVIFLGILFSIKNVYLLFVFSAFLHQCMFLLGTFLLCKRLGFSRLATFLATLATISGLFWYQHYYFELLFSYLLPLFLLLVYQFFTTYQIRYLLLFSVLILYWAIAGMYLIFFGIYLFLLFGVLLFCFIRKPIHLEFSKKDWGYLALFLLCSGLFVVSYLSFKQNLFFSGRAGELASSTAFLNTRTWKGSIEQIVINIFDLVEGNFFTRSTFEQYAHLYTGLLTIVLILYGLLKKIKAPGFYASAISALAILWLSFGEHFTLLVSLFPFIKYYKWIELTYSLVRPLLCISAMYAFEAGIKNRGDLKTLGLVFILAFFLIDSALPALKITPADFFSSLKVFYARLIIYLVISLIVWLFWKIKKPDQINAWDWIKYGLVFAMLFDVCFYQVAWKNILPRQENRWGKELTVAMTEVSKPVYETTRTNAPSSLRAKLIEPTNFHSTSEDVIFHYPWYYPFSDYDPCIPTGYVHFIEKDLVFLNQINQSTVFQLKEQDGMNLENIEPTNPFFNNMVGCGVPKMRLESDVLYSTNPQDSLKLIQGSNYELTSIIIEASPEERHHNPDQKTDLGMEPVVEITSYTDNKIFIDLVNPYFAGAWFYYADAFNPNWHASLDGESTKINKANLAFKAVWVPYGKHKLELHYFQPIAGIMQYIEAISCMISSILIFVLLVKKTLFD